MKSDLQKSQEALFLWMCIKDVVSYQTIVNKCDYLNIQFNLKIEKHPIRQIFFPLFTSGTIDLYQDQKFKITPPICIHSNDTYVYTNILNSGTEEETSYPFIFKSKIHPNYYFSKEYTFCGKSILESFPSIDKITSQFIELPETDFSSLIFFLPNKELGVAKKDALYASWYLIYPNKRIYSIPNWIKEPDALNISYCLSRTFYNKPNGIYYREKKVLQVKRFHFPILLYRVLLIESLLNKGEPIESNNTYIFPCINNKVVKELNRILCNSIHYE